MRRLRFASAAGLIALSVMSEQAVADDLSDCISLAPGEAIEACSRVVDRQQVGKSEQAQAFLMRAKHLLAQGAADRALTDLNRTIELSPDLAEAYYQRGRANEALGRGEQATRDFQRSSELFERFLSRPTPNGSKPAPEPDRVERPDTLQPSKGTERPPQVAEPEPEEPNGPRPPIDEPLAGARNWTKLCEDIALPGSGRSASEPQRVCRVRQEQLDRKTGAILFHVTLRQVFTGRAAQNTLIAQVRHDVRRDRDLTVEVYDQATWYRLKLSKPAGDAQTLKLSLPISECSRAGGCIASSPVSRNTIKWLEHSGGLQMRTRLTDGRYVVYPVELSWFSKALNGPATEQSQYEKRREDLIGKIRSGTAR